jgi:hypothetical protein
MAKRRTQSEVLDRDFLETRCRILDLAAALDRAERASGENADGRFEQLRDGIQTLLDERPDRAEAVQRLFSLEYDPKWRERFGLAVGKVAQ